MSRYPKRMKRSRPTYTLDLGSEDEEDEEDDSKPALKKQASSRTKRARGRTKKKKEEKPFRFMDLPGELRNKVYKHLLCQPGDTPVYISEVWSTKPRRKRVIFSEGFVRSHEAYKTYLDNTDNNFGVLRTCKAVNAEAKSILYGQKFEFYHLDALQTFLLRLNPATIALLRHIDLTGHFSPTAWKFLPVIFALLRPATNLTYLRVKEMQEFKQTSTKHVLRRPTNAATMTVAEWDALVGQQVAREVYSHMHPYLQAAIQVRGAANVIDTLHFFENLFKEGPRRSSQLLIHGYFGVRAPNPVVLLAAQSPARGSAIRAAMAEELARLVANDAI